MMRAAAILELPIVVTEQYPERLGATVDELQPHIPEGHPAIAKKLFSMCTPEVCERLDEMPERTQAVIMGLEAHVCVLQTAMDLTDRGLEVFVLVDGQGTLVYWPSTIQHVHELETHSRVCDCLI
jgi:nicotinamidase-related amidase